MLQVCKHDLSLRPIQRRHPKLVTIIVRINRFNYKIVDKQIKVKLLKSDKIKDENELSKYLLTSTNKSSDKVFKYIWKYLIPPFQLK